LPRGGGLPLRQFPGNNSDKTDSRRKRLGEILRERGQISGQNLLSAIHEQTGKSVLLGELLLERNMVSKSDLVAALEEVTRVRYVDPRSAAIDSEALKLIPHGFAERYCALPVLVEANKLVTVMAEPQNLHTLNELRFVSGLDIIPCLGFRSEIYAAIEQHYALARNAETECAEEEALPIVNNEELSDIEFFTASARQRHQEAIKEFQAELRNQPTPAVRLVSAIISAATRNRASDIHVDPQAMGTVVRIRVDGIIRDFMEVPPRLQDSLISRIKILADMDIAERRLPQDGRFLVRMGQEKRDLRVSTLPTTYGEKIVIRLLHTRAAQVGFLELGLGKEHSDLLTEMLTQPQGTLLVTGPTGSGKTTTLYSTLNMLRSRALNIITVENPVEYMLEGINQVQVNEKVGLTFAGCLRSILRQDPNVIMVGEIRDPETAEIALTAAQTGHLVLSTLHTRDSISAVTRLIDLNIPPFLVASTVTAILAQRLVRRLCTCRDEVAVSPEYQARLLAAGVEDIQDRMYIPVGCKACQYTGYHDRVGVYEMLVLNEGISDAIRAGAGPEEIRGLATSKGMRLLHEDAIRKANMGVTSLEEVLRIVPLKNCSDGVCKNCRRLLAPSFCLCPYCGCKRRKSLPEGGSLQTPYVLPKVKERTAKVGAAVRSGA